MRLYLDKIGLKRKDRPEGWIRPLKRTVKCLATKFLYNVDPRETYDLDATWRMWLYEHLIMFKKEADQVIDMTEKKWEYDGKMYSQIELIEMMIERLEFALSPSKDYNDFDEEQYKYVSETEKIWALICPAMWW